MKSRRGFLSVVAGAAVGFPYFGSRAVGEESRVDGLTLARAQQWWREWEASILAESKRRYCDTETGEQLGWLMAPFLNGFQEAHAFSGEDRWLERLVEWARAWLDRGVTEPDGRVGWPKRGSGGAVEQGLMTDSLLGEAMAFRPLLEAARRIRTTPGLDAKWGVVAGGWVAASERCAEKWQARGAWREVRDGGVWVVLEFGLEEGGTRWSSGYDHRLTTGFTHPANKQNHIARWMMSLYRATGKEAYRERAAAWWRVMKARVRREDGGRRWVWNYWDPAGPWDLDATGKPRHWIGVHPNGGYYGIDVEGMVEAFESGLVFRRDDLEDLVRTQLEFMWNGKIVGAAFRRIDGGEPDARWKASPGVLWSALTPYSERLREIFEGNHRPGGWGGLASTPWYLGQLRRHHLRPYDRREAVR